MPDMLNATAPVGTFKSVTGTNIARGLLAFRVTDANNIPIACRVGSAGGHIVWDSAAVDLVNGGFVGSIPVPNPATTLPQNIRLRLTVTNLDTDEQTVFRKVSATDDGGGVWNLAAADLTPDLASVLVELRTGPQGPKGNDGLGNVALSDQTLASNTSAILASVTASQQMSGPLKFGQQPTISQDPVVTVARTVDNASDTAGIGYAHAYTDDSTFLRTGNQGAGGFAYASYDVRAGVDGAAKVEHLVGFQAIPQTRSSFTGTLNRLIGAVCYSSLQGGHVNSQYGVLVADASKQGGTVDTVYGVYVQPLLAGAVKNWAIYVESNASFFGGNILGNGTSTDIAQVNSISCSRLYAQDTYYDPGDGRTAVQISVSADKASGCIDVAQYGTRTLPLRLNSHTLADVIVGDPNHPSLSLAVYGQFKANDKAGITRDVTIGGVTLHIEGGIITSVTGA